MPVTSLGERCAIIGCGRPVYVGGVCNAHWRQCAGSSVDESDELEVMWALSRLQAPDR